MPRVVILEGGWQEEKDEQFWSFNARQDAFPGGLGPLTERAKQEYGVKIFGPVTLCRDIGTACIPKGTWEVATVWCVPKGSPATCRTPVSNGALRGTPTTQPGSSTITTDF